MDVTRERISRISELREMFPSFQTGFSLVSAAVFCAIMESSWAETQRVTTDLQEKACIDDTLLISYQLFGLLLRQTIVQSG